MGLPKDYKNGTPDGYKESIEFQPGDDIVNTEADKQAYSASIKADAEKLSAISGHE